MSNPTTAPQNQSAFNRALPWLLPALLIGTFLWRALTPAHEYPGRTSTYMEMVIDAALIVGVFGLRGRMQTWLFSVALICGIGLFAIRLNSDASWWTGHLQYYLLPR